MAYLSVLGRPFFVLDETTVGEPYGPLLPMEELQAIGEHYPDYRFWGDGACGVRVDDDNVDSKWFAWVAVSIPRGSDPFDTNSTVRWLALRALLPPTEEDAKTLALEAARLYAEAYELIRDLEPIGLDVLRGLDLEINKRTIDVMRAVLQ